MGSQTDYRTYPSEYTKEEVKKAFEMSIEEALYDHGHSGYSGTIAESSKLQFSDRPFDTVDEAVEYVSDCGVFSPRNFFEQLSSKNVSTAVKCKNCWVVGGHYSW